MIPLIQRIATWIEKNPELAKWIIIIVAALAGLVAVIGLVGVVLPAIITGFTILAGLITVVSVAILALVAVIIFWLVNWEQIKKGLLFICNFYCC